MLFEWLPDDSYRIFASVSGWGAVVSGIAAIYFMHSIYRIDARPFWNHWQVLSSFYGSVLVLDNVLTMHGRKPFTGERRVLVAMA